MGPAGSFWNLLFKAPPLTQARIILAMVVAVIADAVQVMLGPLGWSFADEFIDLATMVAVSWLIGFHPLLLPTFVVELFPLVDMLPTWTACTAAVLVLRRRSAVGNRAPDTPQTNGSVIDVDTVPEPEPPRQPPPLPGPDRRPRR